MRRRSEFATVYSRGRSWSHPLAVLRTLPNGLAWSRFGFAVGKGVGNAVVRNRVKRRMREILRQAPVRPGFDMVVIGRSASAQSSYQELEAALGNLLRRARLVN